MTASPGWGAAVAVLAQRAPAARVGVAGRDHGLRGYGRRRAGPAVADVEAMVCLVVMTAWTLLLLAYAAMLARSARSGQGSM